MENLKGICVGKAAGSGVRKMRVKEPISMNQKWTLSSPAFRLYRVGEGS
jgi:hypothetical protein